MTTYHLKLHISTIYPEFPTFYYESWQEDASGSLIPGTQAFRSMGPTSPTDMTARIRGEFTRHNNIVARLQADPNDPYVKLESSATFSLTEAEYANVEAYIAAHQGGFSSAFEFGRFDGPAFFGEIIGAAGQAPAPDPWGGSSSAVSAYFTPTQIDNLQPPGAIWFQGFVDRTLPAEYIKLVDRNELGRIYGVAPVSLDTNNPYRSFEGSEFQIYAGTDDPMVVPYPNATNTTTVSVNALQGTGSLAHRVTNLNSPVLLLGGAPSLPGAVSFSNTDPMYFNLTEGTARLAAAPANSFPPVVFNLGEDDQLFANEDLSHSVEVSLEGKNQSIALGSRNRHELIVRTTDPSQINQDSVLSWIESQRIISTDYLNLELSSPDGEHRATFVGAYNPPQAFPPEVISCDSRFKTITFLPEGAVRNTTDANLIRLGEGGGTSLGGTCPNTYYPGNVTTSANDPNYYNFLTSYSGNSTFHFGYGNGHTQITGALDASYTEASRIVFGPGITYDDLSLAQAPGQPHLIITLKGSGERLFISGFYNNPGAPMPLLEFENGVVIDSGALPTRATPTPVPTPTPTPTPIVLPPSPTPAPSTLASTTTSSAQQPSTAPSLQSSAPSPVNTPTPTPSPIATPAPSSEVATSAMLSASTTQGLAPSSAPSSATPSMQQGSSASSVQSSAPSSAPSSATPSPQQASSASAVQSLAATSATPSVAPETQNTQSGASTQESSTVSIASSVGNSPVSSLNPSSAAVTSTTPSPTLSSWADSVTLSYSDTPSVGFSGGSSDTSWVSVVSSSSPSLASSPSLPSTSAQFSDNPGQDINSASALHPQLMLGAVLGHWARKALNSMLGAGNAREKE